MAERFPNVRVLAEWPDKVLPEIGLDAYTGIAALTHDPKIDDPALKLALAANCFYIGALGSRKTHAKRVERLTAAGFSTEQIDRIHAPIGLARVCEEWLGWRHPSLWWALALGADLGGNATAVGASANVVALGLARKAGQPISFWGFTKYGLLTAVVTIAVATPYVVVRYFVLA